MSADAETRVRAASDAYDRAAEAFQAARDELTAAMVALRAETDDKGRPTSFETISKLTSLSTVHVRRILIAAAEQPSPAEH